MCVCDFARLFLHVYFSMCALGCMFMFVRFECVFACALLNVCVCLCMIVCKFASVSFLGDCSYACVHRILLISSTSW